VYAIVESGGKQYKVEKGETLLLDRLPAKEGEKVDLRAVVFRDDDVVTDPTQLEKVKVEATISEHLRGPKIKVFKYKAKKGYRRTQGHRSELTRVEITEIKQLTRKPAARKPAEKKAPARKKPAARKPAATKKEGSDGS
jgi:large subunit ribosomal protein L21